jgi:hypothetical protein
VSATFEWTETDFLSVDEMLQIFENDFGASARARLPSTVALFAAVRKLYPSAGCNVVASELGDTVSVVVVGSKKRSAREMPEEEFTKLKGKSFDFLFFFSGRIKRQNKRGYQFFFPIFFFPSLDAVLELLPKEPVAPEPTVPEASTQMDIDQVDQACQFSFFFWRAGKKKKSNKIGVGSDVSHELIEGMARASKGDSAHVLEVRVLFFFSSLRFTKNSDIFFFFFFFKNERMESKLMALLKRSLQPSLENMRLDWNLPSSSSSSAASSSSSSLKSFSAVLSFFNKDKAKNVTAASAFDPEKFWSAPGVVPPALTGVAFLAYAVVPAGQALPSEVVLSATTPAGETVKLVTPVPPESESTEGARVHLLAARTLIRDLERGDGEEKKGEVVAVGTRYGVASRFTSFVAVDTSSNSESVTRTVPKPVVVPQGGSFGDLRKKSRRAQGGGAPMMLMASSSTRSAAPAPKKMMKELAQLRSSSTSASVPPPPPPGAPCMSAPGGGMPPPPRAAMAVAYDSVGADEDDYQEEGSLAPRSRKESSISSEALPSSPDVLPTIVSAQKFNGSFPSTPALLATISATSLPKPAEEGDVSDDAWTTALVLAFLETKRFSQRSEWELMAEKSRKWLDKEVGKERAARLLDAARKAMA